MSAVRIECCGTPGSGKSTLSTALTSALKRQGTAILNRAQVRRKALLAREFGLLGNLLKKVHPRWAEAFLGVPHSAGDWQRAMIDYPEWLAVVHDWLASPAGDEQWREVISYALQETVLERTLASESEQHTLLDESICQRLFSLRGYRGMRQPGDTEHYATVAPLPDVLLLITTSSSTCAERLLARQQLPKLYIEEGRSPDPGLLCSRIDEGRSLLQDFGQKLTARGRLVVELDGSQSVDRMVACACEHLHPLLSKPA